MKLINKYLTLCSLVAIITLSFCVSILVSPAVADNTISVSVFDDQGTRFWIPYGNGTGTIAASITTDNGTVQSGQSSVKQTIVSGTYGTTGFVHIFNPTVNWSAYNGISCWVYGSNSSLYMSFLVFDRTGQDYLQIIKDNFNGWKQFTIDFSTSFSTGSVNMTDIYAIEFAVSQPAPTQMYVDNIVLLGNAPTPTVTPTPTPTVTPTPTPTTTVTPTPTSAPTSTPTTTPTHAPTVAPTASPSPSPTPTSTPSPTQSTATTEPSPENSFFTTTNLALIAVLFIVIIAILALVFLRKRKKV